MSLNGSAKKTLFHGFAFGSALCGIGLASTAALAVPTTYCSDVPVTFGQLQGALQAAVTAGGGGFGFNMWATIVDRDGNVCLVAKSGAAGTQWPGSRVISAQKANTANAFSLPQLALSTANLFSAVQPGGSLFGLQDSNPIDTSVAYLGSQVTWGTAADPLFGKKIGGVNVFGGGLALYDGSGKLIGGLGVSGDSSCADHNIAWRVRMSLNLNHIPGGVAPGGTDGIIYDVTGSHGNFASKSGFGHPSCGGNEEAVAKSIGAGG
jgi:uncharacterized protein GlcG (DUF336 family)